MQKTFSNFLHIVQVTTLSGEIVQLVHLGMKHLLIYLLVHIIYNNKMLLVYMQFDKKKRYIYRPNYNDEKIVSHSRLLCFCLKPLCIFRLYLYL